MPYLINMPELCSIELCTGCSACSSICVRSAITMLPDAEGFLRPVIDSSKCINCGLCTKVCPVLNPVHKHEQTYSPIAAINKNILVLKKSSSGGVFSLLAEWTIRQGGVVFGAVMNEENKVYHTAAYNYEEIAPMRSSKYLQSDIGGTFVLTKQLLKEGRRVLFTGTPCQIAGLYNFLGRIKKSNLLTVDVVCHGTPSNQMFISYLEKLAKYKGILYQDIKNFSFRQVQTWGYAPSFEYNNSRISLDDAGVENLYMLLFLSSKLSRPSCYKCSYSTPNRVSDITIADFWGIGEKEKFPYDTSHGCSLLLLNSMRGKQVFDEVCQDLNYESRKWSEALKRNHQLYRQSPLPKDRDAAVVSLLKNSLQETYSCFLNTPYVRLRHFAGSLLRKLRLLR